MPDKLLRRLAPWYDETPAARVMHPEDGVKRWKGKFGLSLAEVRALVVHQTAGWPLRKTANNFVDRYIKPCEPGDDHDECEKSRGTGTQFYIADDGTVARLIDLDRVTWHATLVNDWALGVETGSLFTTSVPPNKRWIRANTSLPNEDDIPGAKLWIGAGSLTEVLPSWWTSAAYTGPGRTGVGAGKMLFSESQYRTWALLARYVMEFKGLPRNFPALPLQREFENRQGASAAAAFRQIVLADERADMLKRVLKKAPFNIPDASFLTAEALQAPYDAAFVAANGKRLAHNRAWREFFQVYRGVHAHHFCGNSKGSDKRDCPGPLFDFHRLAREVWDYCWYPFDVGFRVDLDKVTTAVDRRAYRRFREDTPLLEYYFDEDEGARTARVSTGIHGPTSSPDTFSLDPKSPVYALANGELVAASFPPPITQPFEEVSLAFALVRHEVFHLRRFPNIVLGPIELPSPLPGSIDYDREPSYVYTLYMHLGRPGGLSFDRVNDDNPDWLNRLLVRKRECDLGVAFYDDDPAHHGIDDDIWIKRPPGVPRRPTTLDGWRADGIALTDFLDKLSTGAVAVKTPQPDTQPIRVLLGDFLGESGVVRSSGGVVTHGIRVETFSPSFVPPTFAAVTDQTSWSPPDGTANPPAIAYRSEWARIPTGEERDALVAIGVDPSLVSWWTTVSLAQLVDPATPADAKLPFFGTVIHYRPLDVARWLNTLTWASEWPKYEVVDVGGNPITAVPPHPRPRRS